MRGGKRYPQKVQIFILFTLKNAFLPLNLQIFCYFPPKNANLDNFFPKKCNFGQFSTSESEKYGKIFSQFIRQPGKNKFLWQNIYLCPKKLYTFLLWV